MILQVTTSVISSPVYILILICCLLVAYYYLKKSRTSKYKLPPGPPTNVFRLIYKVFEGLISPKNIPLEFKKLGVKYGPIVSVPIGPFTSVYIDDFYLLRKAYVEMGDEFSGRMVGGGVTAVVEEDEKKSLLFSEGPFWREHRRFTLTTLRDFGVGKASIEPAILEEIRHFLKAIGEKGGESFDPSDLVAKSVSNLIFQLEIGRRFEYDDPTFTELKRALEENMVAGERAALTNLIPVLRFVPYIDKLTKKDIFTKNYYFIQDFYKKELKEHYENYKPGSKSDFIDAYITERNERVEQNRYPEMFDDATLLQNLNLFFLAGKETTSYTLLWALLYMMAQPDIQRKVQKEIDDVIGRERTPSYEDKLRMPYTEATIMEVMRISCVVGINVPHVTTKDVELNGYEIPKGTLIMNAFWSIHHSEKLFPDPQSFRPERFINENGKAVKPDYLIPFSIGKRFCIGEPLARMELFLYFTSLLQRFTFKIPEGESVCTVRTRKPMGGIEPYRIVALPRD